MLNQVMAAFTGQYSKDQAHEGLEHHRNHLPGRLKLLLRNEDFGRISPPCTHNVLVAKVDDPTALRSN
jgi:hypothetical protein